VPAGSRSAIWLPHNEITKLVALRTDAPVAPVPLATAGCGCTHSSPSATAPTRQPAPPGRPAAAAGDVDLSTSASAARLLDLVHRPAIATSPPTLSASRRHQPGQCRPRTAGPSGPRARFPSTPSARAIPHPAAGLVAPLHCPNHGHPPSRHARQTDGVLRSAPPRARPRSSPSPSSVTSSPASSSSAPPTNPTCNTSTAFDLHAESDPALPTTCPDAADSPPSSGLVSRAGLGPTGRGGLRVARRVDLGMRFFADLWLVLRLAPAILRGDLGRCRSRHFRQAAPASIAD